jgi:hypothetical protein
MALYGTPAGRSKRGSSRSEYTEGTKDPVNEKMVFQVEDLKDETCSGEVLTKYSAVSA